jgi:heme exporter protein D
MAGLGPHADFIIAAYGIATVVVIAMIGWVVLDRRRLNRQLGDLEATGVTRRSQRKLEPAP